MSKIDKLETHDCHQLQKRPKFEQVGGVVTDAWTGTPKTEKSDVRIS